MEIVIINGRIVKKVITMRDALDVVEKAFKEQANKVVQMPPKVYLSFEKYEGDLRAMPCYFKDLDVAGVKLVNSHPNNKNFGLPTVMAITVLFNPQTGAPKAVLDATWLTGLRTGAAGGIAIKYLARKNSKVFGFIGAGTQARFQLIATKIVSNIEEVWVYDIVKENSQKFAHEMGNKIRDVKFYVVEDAKKAVEGVDVLITTTPSKKPVVKDKWVREGLHINAIGADAPGKQELEVGILKRAKVVVDEYRQAYHAGEINVPISKGEYSAKDVYAELAEVVAGIKKGRERDDEITIFDSTGLAMHDIIVANLALIKAKQKNLMQTCELLEI